MSKIEPNNEDKELKIMQVKQYNRNLAYSNCTITIGTLALGVNVLNVALHFINGTPLSEWSIIIFAGISITAIITMILSILNRLGIKSKIEDIKAYLESNGLVLEDEIAKAKGM